VVSSIGLVACFRFFFQAEDGIRDWSVTGVQTCALPICRDRDSGAVAISTGSGDYADQTEATFLALGVPYSTLSGAALEDRLPHRSEERRVGKECRSRWSAYH